MVNEFSYDRLNYVVALSVLSIIYLAVLFIPQLAVFMLPIVVVVFDIIFCILWLAGFAAIADIYGSANCSSGYRGFFYVSYWGDSCKLGKGFIAMGVLNFLLFLVSSVLLVMYTLLPSMKAKTFTEKDQFMMSCLFLKSTPAAVADEENNVESTEAGAIGAANATDGSDPNETNDVVEKVESPTSSNAEPAADANTKNE